MLRIRWFNGILMLSCLLALVCGGLLVLFPDTTHEQPLEVEVATELKRFVNSVSPVGTFSLKNLPAAKFDVALLAPDLALPHGHRLPYDFWAHLVRFASSCSQTPATEGIPNAEKIVLWTRTACDQKISLPEDFFENPPFMHPEGRSYALLAYQRGGPLRDAVTKLPDPSRIFHVSELSRIEGTVMLTPAEQFVATLSLDEWALVHAMARVVVSATYVFLSDPQGDGNHFRVFARTTWDSFLQNSTMKHDIPFSDTGISSWSNVRFSHNLDAKAGRTRLLTGGFAFSLALLLGSVGVITWTNWNQRKKAREKRMFDLKMLAHEMRSPATSLRLAVAEMEEMFDELPTAAQLALLRIQGADAQLSNVLEASRRYLKLESVGFGDGTGEPVSVASLVEGVVSGFEDVAILMESEDADLLTRVDTFWFTLCVGNVVSNAVRHGRPPVRVSWLRTNPGFVVTVADAGLWDGDDSVRLQRYPDGGGGLGIGLSLVEQVLRELGGKLEIVRSPSTTLRLHFPEVRV